MNKKLLSLLLIGAIAVSSTAAFAEGEEDIMLIGENDVTLIEEQVSEEAVIPMAAYIKVSGKVTAIEEEKVIAVTEGEEEFFFNNSALQLTIDKNGELCELAVGDEFTIYVNGNTPMVLSYPANYSPSVVVKESDIEMVIDVDTYHTSEEDLGQYINSANTLALNIGEETEIIKLSREAFDGNLDGCDLVVFYDMATMSIPAQTNPKKVIVLNKEAQEEPVEEKISEIVVNGTKIEYNPTAEVEGLLPIRKVAEALGFTVEWNGELQQVLLNSGMYSFVIGENSYAKGRMMPVELECASILIDGTTYVPRSFFTEILEAVESFENGVLTINTNN